MQNSQPTQLNVDDYNYYSITVQDWREAVAEHFSKTKATIIATIKSVYGVENLPDQFLSDLALRAFLRWTFWDTFLLPQSMNETQKKFAAQLAEVIDIETSKVKYWTVQELLQKFSPQDRQELQPYMKTPLIYWQSEYFRKQVVKQPGFIQLINLVRNLWDKVGLVKFLMEQEASEFIPPNTEIINEWDLDTRRKKLIYLVKLRYNQCKKWNSLGFIIKAGEWASWENIVIVKCNNSNVTANWTSIHDEDTLIWIIEKSIPQDSRYIKWEINQHNREQNKKLPQNFLIQELIPLTTDQRPNDILRKESSINFFIDPESWNINLIATTANITKWWVHQGNIEMVLPHQVIKELTRLAKKFKQYWYRGPLGFDFAWKWKNNQNIEIVIFEANTRFTAPWSGAMLAHKFRSKFSRYPSFAINQHCTNCNKKLKEITWPTSEIPFSSPDKDEQWVVVLGRNPWNPLPDLTDHTSS